MAVTMVMEMPGATQELYESVLDKLGIGPDGALMEGRLAHIASPMEGGWRVVAVWESEDAFNKFAQERLGPAFAAVGGPSGGPPPTFFPVRVSTLAKRRRATSSFGETEASGHPNLDHALADAVVTPTRVTAGAPYLVAGSPSERRNCIRAAVPNILMPSSGVVNRSRVARP